MLSTITIALILVQFLFVAQHEINYIFIDNVCILSIYFTRKSQYLTGSNAVGTAYFSGASESFDFLPENIRNKRHSKRLPWCQLSRSRLY
jgi:hypothetical protein